jgi:DNA-binding NtrC family response regulator/tetratricopeptide (TPR) repeat protein
VTMPEKRETEPSGRDGSSNHHDKIGVSFEELGEFCLASGEFSTAIEYFTKVLTSSEVPDEGALHRAEVLRKLAVCYMQIGECDHALEILHDAFGLIADGQDPLELARITIYRAWAHFKRGEYDLARADCEAVLDILIDEEREAELVKTYNCLGAIWLRSGSNDKALDFYRSALSMARLIEDRDMVGISLNNMGLACKNLGRWEESQKYLEEALHIAEDLGQHLAKGIRLNNLGIIYSKRGLWRRAYKCWNEAFGILMRMGNRREAFSACRNIGHYYMTYRDYDRAEELYAHAMKQSADQGDMRCCALSLEFMGDIHMARGRLDMASENFIEALNIGEEMAPRGDVVVEVRRRLADLEVERGNFEAGLEHAALAVDIACEIEDVFEEACSRRSRAAAEFMMGEWEVARAEFKRAVDALESMGERKELALTLLKAGTLYSTQPSSLDLAVEYLDRALAVFEDLNMVYEASLCVLETAWIAAGRGEVEKCRRALARADEIHGGYAPAEIRDRMEDIKREADERLSWLSVNRSSNVVDLSWVIENVLAAGTGGGGLGIALDACLRKTSADRGVVLLKSGGVSKVLVSRNFESEECAALVPLIEEMLQVARTSDMPVVTTCACDDGRFGAGLDDGAAPRSAALCVPLGAGDDKVGCIYLDTTDGEKFFERAEVEFVVALSGILKNVLSEAAAGETRAENVHRPSPPGTTCRFHGIVTRNKKMLEIIDAVKFLQNTSATVLIEGETGTGKELLAQAIHKSSGRSAKPFVRIDCSALSRELLESELFGHVKGAFTDARKDKVGLFEVAEGGTVFLDEIDKTTRKFQERLLQVVDKREFKRVGSTASRRVDFRLVCATNRDLAAEVRAGNFLEDLYYRLKVISLRIPELRTRPEDVPLLAEHFVGVYGDSLGKTFRGISREAMDVLMSSLWPGNVRQLEHEIERAVTFAPAGGMIDLEHFSEEVRQEPVMELPEDGAALADMVEKLESKMIMNALKLYKGNKTRAAKHLGLSRRGLLNKIHRYNITV